MSVEVAQPTLTPLGANDRIRETSPAGSSDPIAFLCECGSHTCDQSCWVTAAEYDNARASRPTAIVSPSHIPLGFTLAAGSDRYAVINLTLLYDH